MLRTGGGILPDSGAPIRDAAGALAETRLCLPGWHSAPRIGKCFAVQRATRFCRRLSASIAHEIHNPFSLLRQRSQGAGPTLCQPGKPVSTSAIGSRSQRLVHVPVCEEPETNWSLFGQDGIVDERKLMCNRDRQWPAELAVVSGVLQ